MPCICPLRAVHINKVWLYQEVIYFKYASLFTDSISVLRQREKGVKCTLQVKGTFLCWLMSAHEKSPSPPPLPGLKCFPSQGPYCTEENGFAKVWHRELWWKGQDQLMQIYTAKALQLKVNSASLQCLLWICCLTSAVWSGQGLWLQPSVFLQL